MKATYRFNRGIALMHASGAVAAMAMALSAGAAQAQKTAAADAADEGGIREIVVTAEKRSVSVQRVPIAISAFDTAALASKGIQDVTALQSQIPTLKFTVPQGVVQISLRGAGNDSVSTGADNGVGFHYDGVYISNPAGSLADTWDMERIEVLRGPQGTLYGRNTTGGAINLIPNKPSDAFEARGQASYGNYDAWRINAMVNLPLAEGVTSRLVLTRAKHDGYQKNLNPIGRDGDDLDLWAVRGLLAFDLAPNLKVMLMGTYNDNDDNSVSPVRIGGSYPGGGPANLLTTIYSTQPAKPADPRRTRKNLQERAQLRFYGGAGTVQWDLGPVELRSTTAYYKMKRRTLSDWDDSNLDFIALDTADYGKQFSQEVTLVSSGAGSLDYIVGAYMIDFDDTNKVFVDIGEIDGTRPGPFTGTDIFQDINARLKIRSRAIYGQMTWHLSDRVRVTAGGRYTWDRKASNTVTHPPVVGSTVPPPSFEMAYGIRKRWSEPTGRLNIDFDVTSQNMLYANYSHGYKAGAINPSDPTPVNQATRPEKVDSFEIGSKNYFLDRALQLNVAAFYTRYKDIQINTFPVTSAVLVNVPGGVVKGVEIDFAIEPSRNFRVDGSFGYTDSRYRGFVTGNPAFPTGPSSLRQDQIGGNSLINTPKYAIAGGAQYSLETGAGKFTLRADTSLRSKVYFDIFQNADMIQQSYTKTDLRLMWVSPDQRFSGQFFVQNIEDTDIKTASVRPASILGGTVPLAWYAPPRIYGVSFGFAY